MYRRRKANRNGWSILKYQDPVYTFRVDMVRSGLVQARDPTKKATRTDGSIGLSVGSPTPPVVVFAKRRTAG